MSGTGSLLIRLKNTIATVVSRGGGGGKITIKTIIKENNGLDDEIL